MMLVLVVMLAAACKGIIIPTCLYCKALTDCVMILTSVLEGAGVIILVIINIVIIILVFIFMTNKYKSKLKQAN